MAIGSDDDQNNVVSCWSQTEETISTKRRRQSTKTLKSSPSPHGQPLPTIPFDIIPEIFCRLPVKLLLQLRCLCKSWNSLISDSKFAKKQLRTCTPPHLIHTLTHHNIPYPNKFKYVLESYTFDSILTDLTIKVVELDSPPKHSLCFVGSCNGILCLLAAVYAGYFFVRLWNPSIRKIKELPPLEKSSASNKLTMYGFSHDPICDNYKVVIGHVHDSSGNFLSENYSSGNLVSKTDVKVHTLGTNLWKNIQKFPFDCVVVHRMGKFVSGTINWLVSKGYARKNQRFVVSLDLGNESYKEVLLPDDYDEVDASTLNLIVFKDCLCMAFGCDVWIMKEYGNKDSWIKLFTISYMQDCYTPSVFIEAMPVFEPWVLINAMHIFEDGQVLLKSKWDGTKRLFFHNSRNMTFEFPFYFEDILEVCTESLISPYS